MSTVSLSNIAGCELVTDRSVRCCSVSRSPRLLVATSQGVLYVYALDAGEGGECSLLRQHQFLEAAPGAAAAAHEGNAPPPAGGPAPRPPQLATH